MIGPIPQYVDDDVDPVMLCPVTQEECDGGDDGIDCECYGCALKCDDRSALLGDGGEDL